MGGFLGRYRPGPPNALVPGWVAGDGHVNCLDLGAVWFGGEQRYSAAQSTVPCPLATRPGLAAFRLGSGVTGSITADVGRAHEAQSVRLPTLTAFLRSRRHSTG